MGYDLVEWNPRRGDDTELQYQVPQISLGDDNDTKVDVGESDYSSTPTLAEINERSGLNQVIALLNRRILQMNSLKTLSETVLDYLEDDVKIKASHLTDIQTKINTLRVHEGTTVFTFTFVLAGKKILALHLNELRKSLAIKGIYTLSFRNGHGVFNDGYRRTDNPAYNTPTSEVLIVPDTAIGKSQVGLSTIRLRDSESSFIPAFINEIGDPDSVQMSLDVGSIDTTESFNIKFVAGYFGDDAPVLTPSYDGSYYDWDVNSELGEITSVIADSILTLDLLSSGGFDVLKDLFANTIVPIILGTDKELDSTGIGASGSFFRNTSPSAFSYPLILDYGDYP